MAAFSHLIEDAGPAAPENGRLQAPARLPWRPLRIAMIGQRGVPATFGGVEHHVEELGARLADRGHEVLVFCRPNYVRRELTEYRGMRLCHLRTVDSKHLDTIVHSVAASLAALRKHPDIVHYHALGPGIAAPLPRWGSRAKVVQTVHGLDHQRAKWGLAARSVLGTAHWMSARVPDLTIAVSAELATHYWRDMGRPAWLVPNGVNPGPPTARSDTLRTFGLQPYKYLLFVGRFVPEKAPDELIRVFGRIPGDIRLVLAGDSSHTADYAAELKRLAQQDDRIVFTGYVYGRVLSELYGNALAFVLPSHLEGLPLTLLEAAAHGVPIVASDIPPHREVLGVSRPGGRTFPVGNEAALLAALQAVINGAPEERAAAAGLRDLVLASYDWDAAATRTEQLYLSLVSPVRRSLAGSVPLQANRKAKGVRA